MGGGDSRLRLLLLRRALPGEQVLFEHLQEPPEKERGDPNGDGLPGWPAFSDVNPVVMYFGQTPHTGPVPSAESLKSLDAYFAWRRTPEGEGWAK